VSRDRAVIIAIFKALFDKVDKE